LNSPLNEEPGAVLPGRLYVVGTPLGNRGDISLRALEILKAVDLIAAEDTRHTAGLLGYYRIKTPLVSYHDFNEKTRTAQLLGRLRQGAAVALVSNAGTPSVSDPGYALITAAVADGIPIVPIPGPSAVIAALSVAGLPTDAFVFVGFPARKKEKRAAELKKLCNDERTIVFYESPRRLMTFLEELIAAFGNRYGVLAREMTKIHEEFIRGPLSEMLSALRQRAVVKGECTLLVSGRRPENGTVPDGLLSELRQELKSGERSLSRIVRQTAAKYRVSKNEVYRQALQIRDEAKQDSRNQEKKQD